MTEEKRRDAKEKAALFEGDSLSGRIFAMRVAGRIVSTETIYVEEQMRAYAREVYRAALEAAAATVPDGRRYWKSRILALPLPEELQEKE